MPRDGGTRTSVSQGSRRRASPAQASPGWRALHHEGTFMDLATALAQTGSRKGPQCSVCRLIDQPPAGTTADELKAALASDISQSHLGRALHVITGDPAWISRGQAIARHRAQHS